MNLHEFQGKQLFREYGLPVSKGFAVTSVSDAVELQKIGGTKWVVKVQVHAGGRGKPAESNWLTHLMKSRISLTLVRKNLVTYQTDEHGQLVSSILVEDCTDIKDELYLGAVIDRTAKRIVFVISTEVASKLKKSLRKRQIKS